MRSKDSTDTCTGGNHSAGAGVFALHGTEDDASEISIQPSPPWKPDPEHGRALSDRRHIDGRIKCAVGRDHGCNQPASREICPSGLGSRRGVRPEGLHPLRGLIAPNFVTTGILIKADLMDLLDSSSWLHPHTRNFLDLRGAALCAMFACFGAAMIELTRIECSDWLPGGRDEVELGGTRQRVARTMPVFPLPKLVIGDYSRKVNRAPGVTHLFVDADGLPATASSIEGQMKWMTERNGIPVDSLAMALRQAFERWAKTDEGAMWRALTGRVQPQWMPSEQAISVSEKHAALAIAHPLADIDRTMLQWKGPRARRYTHAHFPALSKAARTEYDFALKTRGGTTYGEELRDAVRTALDSGKRISEVATHYGVSVVYVRYVRDLKTLRQGIHLRKRPLQLSLLQHLRSDPVPTAEKARAWAADQGIDLQLHSIHNFARGHGVKLIPPGRFWRVGHGDALLARMRQKPAPSAPDVVEWASKERHIDLTFGQIRKFAAQHEVTLSPAGRPPLFSHADASVLFGHETALLARIEAVPDATVGQHVLWLSKERSVRIDEDELKGIPARGRMDEARGVGPERSCPGRPRSGVREPGHHVRTDPDLARRSRCARQPAIHHSCDA